MHWRAWITDSYKSRPAELRPDFRDGAPPAELTAVEAALGVALPPPLRELLLESDGVDESMHHENEWFAISTHVWSCQEIAEENRRIRSDPEGPRPPAEGGRIPLYISNAGVDGILFAMMIRADSVEDPAIYAYYPIEAEWVCVSATLAAHLQGWKV